MQATSAAYKTTIAGNDMDVVHRVEVDLPITMQNLVLDPSFESSPGYWTQFGSGFAVSFFIGTFSHGTRSYLLHFQAGGVITEGIAGALATKPGNTYTASVDVLSETAGEAPLEFWVNGVTVTGIHSVPNTPGWQRIWGTFTAIDTLTTLFITNAAVIAGPTNTTVDGVMCVEGNYAVTGDPALIAYFDGDSPRASWDSTPLDSTSTLNVDPYPDVTLTVESIEVDRQLTTDMPDGTRLITGYPTASATIVLSGLVDQQDESKSIAWLMNPYSPTSPLYRKDATGSVVTIDAGVYVPGSETLRIFTGVVDDCAVDGKAGTVTLTCLDDREKLRTVPTLPSIGQFMDVPFGGLQTVDPGLSAGWVFDSLLRANGIYASPGPRRGCAFYVSFSGSAQPQIGSNISVTLVDTVVGNQTPMTFVTGNWSKEVCHDHLIQGGFPVGNFPMSAGWGWTAEFWMKTSTPDWDDSGHNGLAFTVNWLKSGGASGAYFFQVKQVSGTTWAFTPWATSSTAHNLTISSGWHQFTVQGSLLSSTSVLTTLYIDKVLAGTWTDATTSAPSGAFATEIQSQSTYPVEALQLTNERPGDPLVSFTPSAVLDLSLNPLTATVDIAGQDPWSVIQELAEAEGGVAGFDERGVFRFANRDSLNVTTSSRAITADASLKSLGVESSASTQANHIVVPVNVLGFSTYQAVWAATDKIVIRGHETYSTVINTDNPVVGVAVGSGVILPSGGSTPTNPVSGYRAARHADGSNGSVINLDMQVRQIGPTSITITIKNPNYFAIVLVTPSGAGYPPSWVGQPCLQVGGEFVTSTGEASDIGTSISSAATADSQWPPVAEGGPGLQEKALILSSNRWRQSLTDTQLFADDLLADLYKPRPLWRNVSIVADPSLQLSDRVTVVDPDASGVDGEDAVIIGIKTVIAENDWTQTVDLRAIAMPGSWIMGQVGRSEMGISTYV